LDYKKGLNFFFAMIAIILGWSLVKHFDFTTYRFADPVLDMLYLIVFVITLYLLIKDFRESGKA
jgi:hypothetical protein